MPPTNIPDKGKNNAKLFEDKNVRAAWDEPKPKGFGMVSCFQMLSCPKRQLDAA
jgi:hypothetical protein